MEKPLELPPMTARKRGLASVTVERRREIARKGGQAAHARGVAHKFTIEEAQQAGRRGGQTVSKNRLHMAAIGRKGGLQTVKKRQARLG